MLTETQRQFLSENHNGALTTFRRSGAAQMSVVTCGPYGAGVAFTTTADRAKLRNLRRNPRCTILVGTNDWRNFLVLEGEAHLVGTDTASPDEYRETLRPGLSRGRRPGASQLAGIRPGNARRPALRRNHNPGPHLRAPGCHWVNDVAG